MNCFMIVVGSFQSKGNVVNSVQAYYFARKHYVHRFLLCLKQSFGFVNSILLIALIRPFREIFWVLIRRLPRHKASKAQKGRANKE